MKRIPVRNRILLAGAALAGVRCHSLAAADTQAGTVEEDWQAIVTLDAGPGDQPKSGESAGAIVMSHLARQEKALRNFLNAHPEDAHAFEAAASSRPAVADSG